MRFPKFLWPWRQKLTDDNIQTPDSTMPPVGDRLVDQAQGLPSGQGYSPATAGTDAPIGELARLPRTDIPRATPRNPPDDLTADELEVVLKLNGEAFAELLDSRGLVLMSKDAAGGGGSAPKELSPNDRLAQHMATYNPGVTHEMKGTPPVVTGDAEDADTDAGAEEPEAEK